MRRRPTRRPRIDDRALALSWQAVSLLLEYPGDDLDQRVELVEQALGELPRPVADGIARFVAALRERGADELRAQYVETFDVTRRCCLYLTYFAHGDTRKRGLALVQVKQAYRRAGVVLDTDELPDHLCVVLEVGATGDLDVAWRLLNEHRAGIEVLRTALAERSAPWVHLVEALLATLPPLAGDDEERLARLIAAGPPQEEVGLDLAPYAMDPRLNPRPGTGPVVTTTGAPS